MRRLDWIGVQLLLLKVRSEWIDWILDGIPHGFFLCVI